MTIVDEYLQAVSASQKTAFDKIREAIHDVVPDVEEVKSYGMPGFKYRGKYLAGFFAYKDHMSFFPTSEPIEVLHDKLGGYITSKGTIQFTEDHPIPDALIRELVLVRVRAIDGRV